MVVLLPGAGRLAALEDALDAAFLDRVVAGFQSTLVDLKLPRFEVRCTSQLGEALRGLGIEGGLRCDSLRLLWRERSSRGAEHLRCHARRLGEGG